MAKTKFEKAFADWPKMKVLKTGGVHLTGVYEHPGLSGKMTFGWVILCLLFAVPTTGIGLALVFFYPIVRPSLVRTFGKKLDVKIRPDRVQVRSGWGYKNYARAMPMEFRVEQHQKAIDEEIRRRSSRTYREAVETVMQYGEMRIAIAELPVKEIEQAKALAFRMQTVCNSLDAAVQMVESKQEALRKADDFGQPTPIR